MKGSRKSKKKTAFGGKSLKKLLTGLAALLMLLFSWVAESVTPPPLPDSANPIELYSNQTHHDLQQTITSAINSAERSILLIIYGLTDNNVIQALKEKSLKGVDVTVISDPKASRHVEKRLGPAVKTFKRFTDGLMHQKILVVDERLVWIGSANMTTESLRTHGNLILGFESPLLASVILKKAESMKQDDKACITHQAAILGNQQVELWFLPDDTLAVERVKQLIKSAQKTLKIAMFTWTRNDFTQEVLDAAKRGVQVEAVIDKQSGWGASAKIVKMLANGGLPIRLSTGSALLHHKFACIDDKILINGSANWTKAAFTQNDDCFIILHDLNKKQKQLLDQMWRVIMLESKEHL